MTGAPPEGVVTFLFTDIEASTDLLARLGSRAPAAFAAHDRIVCAAVRRARGYEVRTEGDSFFIAFARPTDAVAAAVSIQQGIGTYPWPDGGVMRLRIGMHTGEAEVHGRGYVGLAVHLAARIAAAARGGQILLSSATADLVAPKLFPRQALVDRSFKGFAAPHRIIELLPTAMVGASALAG
jgi:class 3 adenylate cyclase